MRLLIYETSVTNTRDWSLYPYLSYIRRDYEEQTIQWMFIRVHVPGLFVWLECYQDVDLHANNYLYKQKKDLSTAIK